MAHWSTMGLGILRKRTGREQYKQCAVCQRKIPVGAIYAYSENYSDRYGSVGREYCHIGCFLAGLQKLLAEAADENGVSIHDLSAMCPETH